MSTEKPAPRRKRATTQPMWQVPPEKAVSRQLQSVTDESWGDGTPEPLPAPAKPRPAAATKPAAAVASKATAPVKAPPISTPAPAPVEEKPKLKSVTSIAAALSGRVTRPIDAAPTKLTPARVEAKPASAPIKVEAKPAAKVELKPLRPLAAQKPIESKPLPALRPIKATAPIAAQKPVEAPKPIEAPRAVEAKPIEAPKAVEAKPIEAPKPAAKIELKPLRPLAPLKPIEAPKQVALKPILSAELPSLPKVKLPGMPEPRASRLAEGSIPPPSSTPKPLPSLFSVIDRKRALPADASPRSTDLPRPKKAVSVVAGALTAVAPLAPAVATPIAPAAVVARQAAETADDEPDLMELSPDDLIEDAVPELLSTDDFIPMTEAVVPAPLPPPPRIGHGSGVSFSALEESFFAAGEELDTGEQEALEPETFDDLPPVERAGFWSRLRSSSARP